MKILLWCHFNIELLELSVRAMWKMARNCEKRKGKAVSFAFLVISSLLCPHGQKKKVLYIL